MATFKSKIGKVVLPLLPFDRRTFDILRYEARAMRSNIALKVSPGAIRRKAEVAKMDEISLNIGSGGKGWDGWVNLELVRMNDTDLCCDVRKTLPLADGTVRRISQDGFTDVMQQKFGVSDDPELAIDQEHHRPYSLYVEASKPG